MLRLPDGRLLGYARYGKLGGVPLLAIHGTPGSRIMMQPADRYASSHNIELIAPDRPGYGLSSSCRDYSFDQWSVDIKALMIELEIDRFWLFGVSGGGPFATAIAALMPNHVRGVALVSPVGLFEEEGRQNWSWRNFLFFEKLPRAPWLMTFGFPIVRFFVLHTPSIALKIFVASLSQSDRIILSKPDQQEQLLVAFKEGFRLGVKGAIEDLQLFSKPWHLPLSEVRAPVILWQGTNDLMVPAQAGARLARELPHVEMISLPGEGHFWIFEHFEEVFERLLAS